MDNNILELLKESGAFMEGHFLLTSGRHSDKYIEKFRLMESPKHLDKVCNLMSKQFFKDDIDIVLGAAIGGILLSSGVAKYLNKKSIFTERVKSKMELKRGFDIKSNNKVLIVEDIVTTGGSIFELIDIIKKNNGEIVGITSIVDRSIEGINFGFDYKPLLRYPIKSWDKDNVPEWLNKTPLTERGRSGK